MFVRNTLKWLFDVSLTHRDLQRCPRIEIDGLDFGDVDSQVAMNPGASDAQEQTQVP